MATKALMRKLVLDVSNRYLTDFFKFAMVIHMLVCLAATYQSVSAQVTGVLHGGHRAQPKRFYPLSIEINPKDKGCAIIVGLDDGRELKPKGSAFNLAAGSYTLNVACEGFKKYSNKLIVPHDIPAHRAPLSISLERLTTEVTIFTDPPEAEILFVNLPPKHTNPDGLLILHLEYGQYEMHVQKDGYLPRPKIVQLNLSKETDRVNVKLEIDRTTKDSGLLDKALEENRIEDAFVLYEKLRSTNFDSPQLRLRLGTLVEKLNQRSSTMLEHLGPNGLILDSLEVADMRRWYVLGRALLAYQQIEASPSYDLFRSVWEVEWIVQEQLRDSAASPTPQQRERILVELGRLEVLQPSNAVLMYELGCIYRRLGEFDSAERSFYRARLSNPSWAYPYFASASIQMTEAYREPKDTRKILLKAADDFEQAILRDAGFIKAYVMLTICYADAHQGQKAVRVALKAQTIFSPDSGQVKFALGYAYFSRGRNEYRHAGFFLEAALVANRDPLDSDQKNTVNNKLKAIKDREK
jgi:tetratricopeptide (TPR) repeat protein